MKDEFISRIKKAEEAISQVNCDKFRQQFHLMPPVGWLNDPNGLCQQNGEYNVFFQYSPFNPNGGEKFWGWYKSRDLVHWHYNGVPLVTDTLWDKNGVYSGSAVAENDKIELFYTGNVKHSGDYDYILQGRESNTIYVSSDNWQKILLLGNEDYPKDCTQHIRDPKVWKENDTYYMVLGARKKCDKGSILLYESKCTSEGWHFVKEITTEEAFGYMWECPDIFTIDGQEFISISPQGVEAENYKYQNIYQSGYFALEGSFKADDIKLQEFTEWDMGFDFYAPQTFEDEGKRRLLIGWVGMPDAEYTNPTVENGWQNCLTLPREIKNIDGKLYQWPVKEIEQLRKEKITISSGKVFEANICDVVIENIQNNDFKANIKDIVNIEYSQGIFVVSLNQYGRGERKIKLPKLNKIRMLVDNSVLEIYINSGEYVFTTMFYPEKNEMIFECPSAEAVLWTMEKMEVRY